MNKVLGEGATSTVKLAKTTKGQKVALKIYQKSKDSEEMFKAEKKYLEGLDHKNIIKLVDSRPDQFQLGLEYASNSDLHDMLSQSGGFEEDLARHYFRELLNALKYL